jgi:SAM-dependent methyltransferase
MSDRPETGRPSPWLDIPATDYEGHMGSPSVGQLTYLSAVFAEVLGRCTPRSLAVVGCATGNGFEHVGPGTVRTVGLDLNPEYLEVARRRFADRLPGLELLQADLSVPGPALGPFDLVHCALVLEYLDPAPAVNRLASWLAPGGVLSVVLQLPMPAHGPVSRTPFRSLESLAPSMRLVDPVQLGEMTLAAGLSCVQSRVDTLPSGKQFHVSCHRR